MLDGNPILTVSLHLSEGALQRLNQAVAAQVRRGCDQDLSRHKVTTRSSNIESLKNRALDGPATLDHKTIECHVASLAQEFGADKVSLFGSFARGEATDESDVDLLLEKGQIKGMKVLEFQDRLAKELERKVDVVTTEGASPRFLSKIRQGEIVLYAAN